MGPAKPYRKSSLPRGENASDSTRRRVAMQMRRTAKNQRAAKQRRTNKRQSR